MGSVRPVGAAMRIVAQLIGTLLLVGVCAPVLVADRLVLAAVAAWKYVPKVWAAHQARVAAEQQRLAAIASRADQQHAWVLASDPRRTYGADFSRLSRRRRDRQQPERVRGSPHLSRCGTSTGRRAGHLATGQPHGPGRFLAVEPRGFEPLTSALQRRIAVHVNGFQPSRSAKRHDCS